MALKGYLLTSGDRCKDMTARENCSESGGGKGLITFGLGKRGRCQVWLTDSEADASLCSVLNNR